MSWTERFGARFRSRTEWLIHLSNSPRRGVTSIGDTHSRISGSRPLHLKGFIVKPQIYPIGHSQAAPRTPLLPSLGTGEVLAFGEGVALPTRLKFRQLPPRQLPRSEAVKDGRTELAPAIDHAFVAAVLDRWRGGAPGPKASDEQQRAPVEHELAPRSPSGDTGIGVGGWGNGTSGQASLNRRALAKRT